MFKNKYIRFILRVVAILLLLLLLLSLLIRLPSVQNFVQHKILESVSENYQADWRIDDIKISFFDKIEAKGILLLDQSSDTLISAEHLTVDISFFSLFGKKISIDNISIENAYFNLYELPNGMMNYSFVLNKSDEPVFNEKAKTTSSSEWLLDFNIVNLNEVELNYKTTAIELALLEEELFIDVNKFDIAKKTVAIEKLQIQNEYSYLSLRNSESNSSSSILPDLGWNIKIDALDIHQKRIELNDQQLNQITELNLKAENLNYQADSLAVDIKQLNGKYNDQFQLKEGSAELAIYQNSVDVKQLDLRTRKDKILADQLSINLDSKTYNAKNLSSDLSYTLLKTFKPIIPIDLQLVQGAKLQGQVNSFEYNPQSLLIQEMNIHYGLALSINGSINIEATEFGFQKPKALHLDLKTFNADLYQIDEMFPSFMVPDSLRRYQSFNASGVANGNLQSLTLDDVSIEIDDVLKTTAKGVIQNIYSTDSFSYDLSFEELKVNTQEIPYATSESIDIQALGQINYVGNLLGNRSKIKLKGSLNSSIGDADSDIVLGFKDGIEQLTYKGNLGLSKFDLGTFLKDESLGTVTITTELDGQGTNLQEGKTKLKGVIKDFEYKGYTYDVIRVDAHLQEGKIEGLVKVDDPNAQLKYNGTVSLGNKSVFDFSIHIDTINLKSLNLYSEQISLSGAIQSQLSLPISNEERQTILIKDLHMSNPSEEFYEDSISIVGFKSIDSTFFKIMSDAIELNMEGVYKLSDLKSSINDFVNLYIEADTISTNQNSSTKNIRLYGQLNTLLPFNVLLVDHTLQSKTMNIDLSLDFEQNSLKGEMNTDSLFYNDFFSENLLLTAATTDSAIDLDLVGNLNSYNGTPINNLKLNNKFTNNLIQSSLSAKDRFDNIMLELSTQTQYDPKATTLTILDNLILNNNDWKVNGDNVITLENDCFTISDFELTDGLEKIRLNNALTGDDQISVVFERFEAGTFADLLLDNSISTSGTINGEIDIRNLCTNPYFIANLSVNDIVYDSTYIGTLAISGDSDPNKSIITSHLSLIGPNNKVFGNGTYNTALRELDLNLSIDSLQLFLLDPFLDEIIKDSNGHLSGELSFNGTIQEPNISGSAEFHNTITTIVANNTQYRLDDHIIEFDETSINIGTLDILDDEGNTAIITGKIYHEQLQDMLFDLKIDTEKFIFLNTTTKENPVLFGKVLLAAEGNIIGPPNLLKVDITAKSLEGTEITISPYSAETYLKEDFITYGKPEDFEDLTDEYLLQLAQKYPFDLTLLLDVSEDSKLTLVIDPINGDKVQGFGFGNLKIEMNPNGEQEFYGMYTVKEGTYSFSYGTFVFKEFLIKQGGTVVFNGNLLNAEVNIDAVHEVYTTTYELIKDEVSLDASDVSKSQSRTNVEVYLTLVGSLSNTEILLDIKIPDLESSSLVSPINSKLNELREDPNELNNQVFGLLIFNSFMLSQNSTNNIGTLGSNLALSSISELVSNQLNQFAQSFIKGVDVNINVNSYDSQYVNNGAGGNVTEVGLQVSKQLFNDRLSVSATGNVDLEENDQEGYSTVVGDFILEYRLTPDGRYRVRVFSKTDYDRLLNENNNKNGVSLFFKKSFDSKKNKPN